MLSLLLCNAFAGAVEAAVDVGIVDGRDGVAAALSVWTATEMPLAAAFRLFWADPSSLFLADFGGFPVRRETLYTQRMPAWWQRWQDGRSWLQRTLDLEQLSHDSRNLDAYPFFCLVLGGCCQVANSTSIAWCTLLRDLYTISLSGKLRIK